MEGVFLLIAAIIGGYGLVVFVAASLIIGLAWVRVLRGMREHDEAERRLKDASASFRRRSPRSLPNQNTSGFR